MKISLSLILYALIVGSAVLWSASMHYPLASALIAIMGVFGGASVLLLGHPVIKQESSSLVQEYNNHILSTLPKSEIIDLFQKRLDEAQRRSDRWFELYQTYYIAVITANRGIERLRRQNQRLRKNLPFTV